MTWGLTMTTPMHVVPMDDLRDHTIDTPCWCRPVEGEDGIWVHESMDGREAFESGERLPS